MKKLFVLGVTGLALVAGLSACAGSSTPAASSSPTSTVDPALAKLVPADIAAAGSINGGANFQAPPFASYEADGKTPTGAMIGIVDEAAHRMGLTVNWQQTAVTDQIPALQGGKATVIGTATAADANIVQQANVVGVFHNQQGIFALTDNAGNFKTIDDVCGKTVAVGQSATGTVAILNKMSAQCTSEGKAAINNLGLSGTSDIILAVQSGRADAGMLSTASIAYTVQGSGGKLAATTVGDDIAKTIPQGGEGFVVAKNQTQLAQAFEQAVNGMIADGTYAKIMNSFNVPSSLFFTQATLNDSSVSTQG